MKPRSLFWGYVVFLIVLLLDLLIGGFPDYNLKNELLFYGMLLLGALSFLFYFRSLNLSSFLLMIAFYLELFLLSFLLIDGKRGFSLMLSYILTLYGVIFCISRMEKETKKTKISFPPPSQKRRSKKEALNKELRSSSLEKPRVEFYRESQDTKGRNETEEIKSLLQEIEDKAKNISKEIKSITKKHIPKARYHEEKQGEGHQQVYVAGKNSVYYHIEDCPVAKRLVKKRKYPSKEKAENAGLKPHFCVK